MLIRIKSNEKEIPLLFYGGEDKPMRVFIAGKEYYIQLRRKRYALPFSLRLDDFTKEVYPGTEIAKSFESMITIKPLGGERKVRVYMNNPLRYKGYTFFKHRMPWINLDGNIQPLLLFKIYGDCYRIVRVLLFFWVL